MNADARGSEADVLEGLLAETSRTFALAIPQLPPPARLEVTVAYLLFRVADTLEDATLWAPPRKQSELAHLAALLREPSAERAVVLARDWSREPPLEHAGYRRLLGELPLVLGAWSRLRAQAREPIRVHSLRTVEAMGEFVRRAAGGARLELLNLGDLRDYCYAVAGIVGEMLTELFLLGAPALEPAAAFLRRRAAAFGEALQLVNILRDADGDAGEGRYYLPREVARGEVFALARADLVQAGEYVQELRKAGAEPGVVSFCELPVRLAGATLDLVERDGPGAKLRRAEVMALAGGLDRALGAG